MGLTRHDREAAEDFGNRYMGHRTSVERELERAVIGGDWGADGYTTVAQADLLRDSLHLGPGHRLLDVGSGRGWPGTYLAHSSGCILVSTDIQLPGLRYARRAARRRGFARRVHLVAATPRDPPFRPASFDAVVHTDVFC